MKIKIWHTKISQLKIWLKGKCIYQKRRYAEN